ncbi:MAG: bestrophin family protein [Aureispira sp.]
MYAKRNYGFWMTINWTKKPLIYGFIYTCTICGFAYLMDYTIKLPWQPISIIGIAVAFYLGFKNNASYDRTWEARKIWGGIVNDSRSFSASVLAFVQGENQEKIRQELIYRHIAWLTALRYQLRLSKEWEHKEDRLHKLFNANVCEQYIERLDSELKQYISQEEIDAYRPKANTASQLLATQIKRLRQLCDLGYFNDFKFLHLQQLMTRFYDGQGKAERIKNFPFPRQYASVALWLSVIFAVLVPFGMLDIFHDTHTWTFMLVPFIAALIIWVFFLMEKIGDYSENPFEGTYNDVPITSIARGIEIDIRQMFDDEGIPDPIAMQNGFLL